MNGEQVGVWHATRRGAAVFQYHDEWLRSPRVRALSLSLPILPGNQPHRGNYVEAWFDNLLPDSAAIRERLAKRFEAESDRPFDLLAAIGRDCVGAVQIVPAGTDPGNVRQIESEPLTDADVAKVLRGVTAPGLPGLEGDASDLRISIAGAQEKMALLRLGSTWHRPLGATPTTHILKLPLGLVGNLRANLRESIENEWLCMHFLGELGLPVPNTEIARFTDSVSEEKALIVERFDREMIPPTAGQSPWIVRLPQEDICQATGTPSAQKYESDGGPGIVRCLGLISAGQRPNDDAVVFAKAQLAFWLLAAPDGHAKNFSIFLRRSGYVLTPLYDVLSAWPIIGRGPNEWALQDVKLAMAVRGKRPHRHISRIALRHWQGLALQTGVPDAFDQMLAMVERAEQALQSVQEILPPGFPEEVWTRIARGVLDQRTKFLDAHAFARSEMRPPAA